MIFCNLFYVAHNVIETKIRIERSIDMQGREALQLFGQCISLHWNARRHEMMDAITECFISITSANSWNSMKRFVGGRPRAEFVQIGFPIPIHYLRLSTCVLFHYIFFLSYVWNRCFADRSISIMLNIEVLRIFHFCGTRRKLASHLLQQETARHCW